MWRVKLCLFLDVHSPLPVERQIRAAKAAGFDGFFTRYHSGDPVADWKRAADEADMEYQALHAPTDGSRALWEGGDAAETAVAALLDCLHACADNGVTLMVMHVFCGYDAGGGITETGLRNYTRVIDEAERLGIRVALENTEGEPYLAALMRQFEHRPHVGFCWDTGHELCYNHGKDMMALYGNRLMYTHLNDNLGIRDYHGAIGFTDDLHLLPFDGIADWKGIVDRLNASGFDGALTFELKIPSKPGRFDNAAYERLPFEEYLALAYQRACRVAALKLRRAHTAHSL